MNTSNRIWSQGNPPAPGDPGTAPARDAARVDQWADAIEVVSQVLPGPQWRRRSAEALADVMSCTFAGVFTCAPGQLHAAQAAFARAAAGPVIEAPLPAVFVHHLLATTASGAPGTASDIRLIERGPTRAAPDASCQSEFEGACALASSLLTDDAHAAIGGFIVGFAARPPVELLWSLETLAVHARTALRHALALAVACGARSPAPFSSLATLTDREREIAALAASGHSDGNIAAVLGIAESTVGSHLRRIYRKLSISSRVELARLGV